MKIIEEGRIIYDKSGFGVIQEVTVEGGAKYARKIFKPYGAERMDPEMLEDFKRRFSREVRIQERLSSDYCIPIIYSSLEENQPWFLMPIAEKVFTQEIQEAKTQSRHVNGLADILVCMEYLHQRGFVHRDIKPGNILFHEGRWKLADMGLITSDPELTTSFATKDGFASGSIPYMAPEQYIDFQNVTPQADIYSFGAILHDIFNGKPRQPYKKHSSDGRIGVIIEKCTEENPTMRFSSVNVLRNVLLSALSKQELPEETNIEINQWVDEMKGFETWDINKLDAFAIFIERYNESKNILFYEITPEFLKTTKEIDRNLWKRLVKSYLKWIENTGFDFNYCDVLIGHIVSIYKWTKDLSIKSLAIFSAAELGRSHNRWYVMGKVVEMGSPEIDEVLADRIAIELHASGLHAKSNFLRCVEQINKTKESYHSLIKDALSSK